MIRSEVHTIGDRVVDRFKVAELDGSPVAPERRLEIRSGSPERGGTRQTVVGAKQRALGASATKETTYVTGMRGWATSKRATGRHAIDHDR